MLLRAISDRWPGLLIRTAVKRHLRHQPQDLRVLARELRMDTRTLRKWLDEDLSAFRVTAWADYLPILEKYNKKQKKKNNRDPSRVARIKGIGADVYVEQLLKHSAGAFRKAAEALIDT